MSGCWVGVLAAACAAGVVAACGWSGATAQEQQAASACGGDVIGRGTVKNIIDGRTFALDDGREVRLAAIEAPPLPAPQDEDAAPGGRAARAALDALAGGEAVVLRRAAIATDRYQRLVAYVYTQRDGDEIFVQGELLAAGAARLGDTVGNAACAKELTRREAAARAAKLGLWADPYYDVLRADEPADVLAQRGRFALVEGTVESVHESGASIYVNFGRRWAEDFAVTILKRNARSFAAAGLDPFGLAGRRVLVRGWIEARGSTAGGAAGSPRIEAAHPEQIEPADGDRASDIAVTR